MATERLRFFRTDSTAGGNGTEDRTDGATRAYATLSAAIEAQDGVLGNLVSDDEYLTLRCTQGGVDTALVVIDGFTTDATRNIRIEFTGAAHHGGTSRENSGTGYQLKSGTLNVLTIAQDYTKITGMEVAQSTSSLAAIRFLDLLTVGEIDLDQCIAVQTNGTAANGSLLIATNSAGATANFTNCLIIGHGSRAIGLNIMTVVWDHCGISSENAFAQISDASHTFTNCWSAGAATGDFYDGSGTPLGDYNASLDGTAVAIFGATINFDLASGAAEFTTWDTNPSIGVYTILAAGTGQLVGAGTGSETVDITGAARTGSPDIGPYDFPAAVPSCAITGTAVTADEPGIVTGSKTIILTLTNDTWVAAGTGPIGTTAHTQEIIDGLDSAQVEAAGWNAEVRDKELTANVVRTSATVCTITLQAAAAYEITADETITFTCPANAVTSATSFAADATFPITATEKAVVTGTVTASVVEADIVTGSKTVIITLEADTWLAAGTGPIGTTANTQAIIDGLDSAQSEGTGWNAEVRDKELTANVVRTSASVCTITLQAAAAYDITAQEVITMTVPAEAVTGNAVINATPTFTVDFTSTGRRTSARGLTFGLTRGLTRSLHD